MSAIEFAHPTGLTIDELSEPGSVRPQLLGGALAVVYAGLVGRPHRRPAS